MMDMKDKNRDEHNSTSAAVPVGLGGTASMTSGPSGPSVGGASASGSFFDDNFASSLEDPPPATNPSTNTGTGSSSAAAAAAAAAAGTAGPNHASGLLFGDSIGRNLDQYLFPTTGIGATSTGDEESRTSTFISLPSATSSASLEYIITKCLDAHHFGRINPFGPVPRNSRSLAATSREIGPPEPTDDGLGGLARTATWTTVLGQGVTYHTTVVMRVPLSGHVHAYPTSMTYERIQPNFATKRVVLSYRPDRSVEKQAWEDIQPNGRTKVTVQHYDARNQPVGKEEVVREDPPVDVVDLAADDGAMTVTSGLTGRDPTSAWDLAAVPPSLTRNQGGGVGNDAFELNGRIDEESSGIERESDDVAAYNHDQQVFALTPPPPPRLGSATAPPVAAAADGSNQLSDDGRQRRNEKWRRTRTYLVVGVTFLAFAGLAAGLGIALSSSNDPPPPPLPQEEDDQQEEELSPSSSNNVVQTQSSSDGGGNNVADYSNPCDPNPCGNGGKCLLEGGGSGFTCSRPSVPMPTPRPSPLPTPRPTPRPTPGPTRRPTPWPTRKPTRAPTAPPDPCDPNPCRNGGTCRPRSGGSGFTCSCPPDYTGNRCAKYDSTAVTTTTATNNNGAQCSFLNTSPAQLKLLPDDGAAYDRFGRSVAIDGDTIVVGAWGDVDNGYNSGSAYVFTRESTGTAWRQQDKLLPNDGAAYDWFGYSVAIDGDTIVVGARLDDDNGSNSGSAYVFARESAGTAWRQQDKLLPNDGAAYDWFGWSVAIDGDTIVVGAYYDDDNGSDSGSAYVFTRESTGAAWRQQAKLLPDDGAAGDWFGTSVAIDGDTIVVGAVWDDDNGSKSGSAYVFTRESAGTSWRQQDKLLPDDGAAGDIFGESVAIDGDTVVVGAYGDDDNGEDSGSAYVFNRESTGTAWRQQAKLFPDDGAAGDTFGESVAIDGKTIVVGNDNGSNSGSAYVFTRESAGTSWRQQAKLLPDDGAAEDVFGESVAIDGDTIVVGSIYDDDNGSDSGSAYVFNFC